MTKKELSKLYDEFYQRGIEILEKYGNPCKPTEDGSCQHPFMHFCCGARRIDKSYGCMFLEKDGRKKKQGCTVKSLFCKMWLCGHLQNKYPDLKVEMRELRFEAMRVFPECQHGYEKDFVINYHLEKYYHER